MRKGVLMEMGDERINKPKFNPSPFGRFYML